MITPKFHIASLVAVVALLSAASYAVAQDDLGRVKDEVQAARETGRLALNWLETLTPEIAGEIAKWGEGATARSRTLSLGGISDIDVQSAEALAAWVPEGASSVSYSIELPAVQRISADAASKLADWGAGSGATFSLTLGLTALDSRTAGALGAFGEGDRSLRQLFLDSVRSTTSSIIAVLIGLFGNSTDLAWRTLSLNGLTSIDNAIATELAKWGSGGNQRGGLTLSLNGVRRLDKATITALVGWGNATIGQRALTLNGLSKIEHPEIFFSWGAKDAGCTRALTFAGVSSIDVVTAKAIAGWGKGDGGGRTVALNGVSSMNSDVAAVIKDWGGAQGDGARSLQLSGLARPDRVTKGHLQTFKNRSNCNLICPAVG